MNAVVQATGGQGIRGAIKGTLSDADVKRLLVRAATARSVADVHGIIRVFCQNRVALTRVIDQLKTNLGKPRSPVSSQFDMALLEQLKVVRTELDEANQARHAALKDALEAGEKLHRMEQLHDNAQRLAERVQRELLLANMEREHLQKQNADISEELNRKTHSLTTLNEEVTALRDRLVTTDLALSEAIEHGSRLTAERASLRNELAAANGDVSDLKKRIAGLDRLIADLRGAVRKHVFTAAEDKKMIHFLSTEVMTARFKQLDASGKANAVPLPNIVGTNVVPFASNAELEKLRQHVKMRDSSIAGKDNTIWQLSSANSAMKDRLSEIESRANQADATLRAQALANDTLAKHLLEILPEDQRSIYSRPSHDASSLVLITNAVKRHVEKQAAAADYNVESVGRSL